MGIHLRPFSALDEGPMIAMLRDERVSRTFMLPDFASDAEAAQLFRRLMRLSEGEELYVRGAYDGDRLVGFINQVSAEEDTVEVGYVVAPEHWNRGYGTAMLRSAMAELFRRGWKTVRAGYFEGNAASRRVMEKSGMTPIAFTEKVTYRGTEHDCRYMERHN